MDSGESKPLITDRRRCSRNYGTSINSCLASGDDLEEPEEWPPRKQSRTTEKVVVGSLNLISAKYESLDYDVCENYVLLEEERKKGYQFLLKKNLVRWFVFLVIGVLTAIVGVIIDISIDQLSNVKFTLIKQYLDDQLLNEDCLYVPYLIWAGLNVSIVFIGSVLVAYAEPVAGGSGIPQVKCYLNGVKMPRIVRIKTLIVKAIGVVSTVAGGLAGGKEGPMIHAGAIVAAGISQGKTTSFNKDFGIFQYFREDHEKRDFVSGGAAAGVAAAFGAPVGGVLFSLEEGTSFWNQSLTWRIFFASSVCTFTLNVILSAYHGRAGELTYYGLLNFGHFDSLNYELFELLLFLVMGAIGGLIGSFYNHCNYKLTVFRMRYVRARWLKVLEACIVAAISATIGLGMIYWISDCRPLGQDPTKYPIQMYCGDGEYNSIAAIWLQTPEASVRSLFHDPPASHKVSTIALFVVAYLFLSIWTYGLSVSAGIFIPCLLTGAAWGRMVGIGLGALFPDAQWVDPGKYALIGAAAQLGGVVRMTISLTIILIEATGNINFLLPLMITLITAKWVGDYFCEGFYDIHIQLSGVPLLGWEPPPLSSTLYASEIMSFPVVTFKTVETVGNILDVLTYETYNGFPVVDPYDEDPLPAGGTRVQSFGRLRGLILRTQLMVLLHSKVFYSSEDLYNAENISMKMFRDQYPRCITVEDLQISERERNCFVDLRPVMNPSPYTVQHNSSLPRVFRLFRALGLRHLIVLNDVNEVVGMVTRKDLARYRLWKHHGCVTIEELKIYNEKL